MTEGKITVRINEKGEIVAETHNILGPSCLEEVTKLLEEIATITEVRKTDEYYMKANVLQKVKAIQEVKE